MSPCMYVSLCLLLEYGPLMGRVCDLFSSDPWVTGLAQGLEGIC